MPSLYGNWHHQVSSIPSLREKLLTPPEEMNPCSRYSSGFGRSKPLSHLEGKLRNIHTRTLEPMPIPHMDELASVPTLHKGCSCDQNEPHPQTSGARAFLAPRLADGRMPRFLVVLFKLFCGDGIILGMARVGREFSPVVSLEHVVNVEIRDTASQLFLEGNDQRSYGYQLAFLCRLLKSCQKLNFLLRG